MHADAFRLRSNGQPVRGYVIHLLGDELARILRRLRLAEASGARALNHATISFDYRKAGLPFELSPEGLEAAFRAVVGEDARFYLEEKQRQLSELGYDDGGLEGEALIRVDGPEHLSRIMLGLAPLRPERLEVYDRRFGIRLPYKGDLLDSVEEFRVELPHLGKCDVVVRGGALSAAAVFEADLLVPPPLANGPWLLVRHQDFTITFTEHGLNFQTSAADGPLLKTLAAWRTLFRALDHLASGSAQLSISRGPETPPLSLPVEQPLEGPYLDQLPAVTRFLDGWQRLLEMAGLRSDAPFAMNSIWDADDARIAVDVLLGPERLASFEFDNLDGVVETTSVKAIYFNICSFAGAAISYCVEVTLEAAEEGGERYRSTGFRAVDVRPAVADLEEYGMEQARSRGVTVLIDPKHVIMMDTNARDVAVS